jgi:hypothetical protein
MKRLLLPLLLCSALAHGTPFYEGKSLAHPAIGASQDSGLDIAFLKEKDGVNGYYCECKSSNAKPVLLDRFDSSVIRSVFYAALDKEGTTACKPCWCCSARVTGMACAPTATTAVPASTGAWTACSRH